LSQYILPYIHESGSIDIRCQRICWHQISTVHLCNIKALNCILLTDLISISPAPSKSYPIVIFPYWKLWFSIHTPIMIFLYSKNWPPKLIWKSIDFIHFFYLKKLILYIHTICHEYLIVFNDFNCHQFHCLT